MGSSMAGRLRASSHQVRAWNRSPEKATAWAREGGTACESPEQAARGSAQAHLMLADDDAVDDTLFGPHGLLSGLEKGALIVDHSTVSVAGAKRRSDQLARGGWRFLQCPVFGSPPNIVEGQGTMLIGGDRTVYEKAQPILAQILAQHFFAGTKPEEASAFKLMGNCMLVFVVEGLAEFLTIAKANGIEPKRALMLFDVFNPCGTIGRRGPRMASGNYRLMFSLAMANKDVGLMLDAASDSVGLPGLETIAGKMKRLIDSGYADLDLSALGIEAVPASPDGSTR